MIKFEIEGTANSKNNTSTAKIEVDTDYNVEKYNKHYTFDFSADAEKSNFSYGKTMAVIRHRSNNGPYFTSSEEFSIFDERDGYKSLLNIEVPGVTLLPNSKDNKKLGMVRGIGDFTLDRSCYASKRTKVGMKYTCRLTDYNNPFLEDVKFDLLPMIDSIALPPFKYEGFKRQIVSIGTIGNCRAKLCAEFENNEMVSLKFDTLQSYKIDVSNSGDDAFGSTIIKVNNDIKFIRQSKIIARIVNNDGTIATESLADGNDVYECAIAEKAEKLVNAILESDENLKAIFEKAYDVDIYHIELNSRTKKDYFYITDHTSVWAVYRTDLTTMRGPVPLYIAYENTSDCYEYSCTYYNDNSIPIYKKTITDYSQQYSVYTEETTDYKVTCTVNTDGDDTKYYATITRNTGGSGYLRTLIEKFVDIFKYGVREYYKAIESIVRYNHAGQHEPLNMYRYLRKIESICKDPVSAMRWASIFTPRDSLELIDIDLLTDPSNTMKWAKLMLLRNIEWSISGDSKVRDELEILDRVAWSDFLLPDNFEVDDNVYAAASNSCEAMYLDD
jgi:hypothetical protein